MAERFKNNFLTTSERSVKDSVIETLKSQIVHEITALSEELGTAQESMDEYFERISEKLEDYKEHKENTKRDL